MLVNVLGDKVIESLALNKVQCLSVSGQTQLSKGTQGDGDGDGDGTQSEYSFCNTETESTVPKQYFEL